MNAMDERKRHISFGLPGRLSINGFGDEESGVSLRPLRLILLGSSAALLAAYVLASTGKHAIANLLHSVPFWLLPAVGIGAALAACRRPTRAAALALIVLWILACLQFSR